MIATKRRVRVYNLDESILECQKYLKSLQKVINNHASLTLLKIKVVNKNRIDDILCCLEASFPDEYKKLLKQKNASQFKSISLYRAIKENIQKKWIFSSNDYSVKYKEAQSLISGFSVILEQDIRFLYNNL